MQRIRLADVAARAGVTIGAASQALNGKPGVSESTRRHIREIAREMGYAPHAGARSIAKGRTDAWGLFFDGDAAAWAPWVKGVMGFAEANGLRLEIHPMPPPESRAGVFEEQLASSRLDGLILLDPDGNDAMLRDFRGGPKPVVISGRRSQWFDSVEIHDHLAQEEILARLSLGGKRPVALVATREQVAREDRRISEWNRSQPDRPPSPLVVVPSDSPKSGVSALGELLRRDEPIHAALCLAGDRTAWGMLRECGLRHISVPGKLAVAGWGDVPFSDWMAPELTTVRIPWEELGTRSARMLQERLARPMGSRAHRTLDASLVSRRSA